MPPTIFNIWAIFTIICGLLLFIISVVLARLNRNSTCNQSNLGIFMIVNGIVGFITTVGWAYGLYLYICEPDVGRRYDSILDDIAKRKLELMPENEPLDDVSVSQDHRSQITRVLPETRVVSDITGLDGEGHTSDLGRLKTKLQDLMDESYQPFYNYWEPPKLRLSNYEPIPRSHYRRYKTDELINPSSTRCRRMWERTRSWAYIPISNKNQVLCLHSPMPWDGYKQPLQYTIFEVASRIVGAVGVVAGLGILIWGTYMVSKINRDLCDATLWKSALSVVILNWGIPTIIILLLGCLVVFDKAN